MIQFVNINEDKNIIADIKKLYHKTFPKGERAPFFFLKSMAKKDKADFFGIRHNKSLVGMLYTVYYKDIVFVFYLAIDKTIRGKGYGSEVISLLKEKYHNKRIILNIEEACQNYKDFEARLKRKLFYKKNNFKETDVITYERGTMYEMMCYGGNISFDEYKKLLKNYLGKPIFSILFRQADLQ